MTGADASRVDSIRQRLLNRARAEGEEFQLTLDRYAVERLLYRLSISPYRDTFLLKGALLFSLWFEAGHRPTRDADFLGLGPADASRLEAVIRELCAMALDDGLDFDVSTLAIEPIREEATYDGLRASLKARLGRAVCVVQWDVGYGDAVTPAPMEETLPTLLDDLPAPRLRVYPRETVFAEKLEAMAVLGMANSRMKDYFDLLGLVREERVGVEALAAAVNATFARRGTALPAALPIALTESFAGDPAKQRQWNAFLSRNRLQAPPLAEVVRELAMCVEQVLTHSR